MCKLTELIYEDSKHKVINLGKCVSEDFLVRVSVTYAINITTRNCL